MTVGILGIEMHPACHVHGCLGSTGLNVSDDSATSGFLSIFLQSQDRVDFMMELRFAVDVAGESAEAERQYTRVLEAASGCVKSMGPQTHIADIAASLDKECLEESVG